MTLLRYRINHTMFYLCIIGVGIDVSAGERFHAVIGLGLSWAFHKLAQQWEKL